MARPEPNGGTMREHLEVAAKAGNARARAQLRGPHAPESISYLRDWLYQLYGTSGLSMDGVAPLSWTTIRDWASFVGLTPPPTEDEVSALRLLDGVLRAESRPKPPATDTAHVRERA